VSISSQFILFFYELLFDIFFTVLRLHRNTSGFQIRLITLPIFCNYTLYKNPGFRFLTFFPSVPWYLWKCISLFYPRMPQTAKFIRNISFFTHWTYMLNFRRIFLSNYWWQESDIWSQASYRYAILWKAFWTHQIPTSCLPKSGGIFQNSNYKWMS
jgi:hypothetical protein